MPLPHYLIPPLPGLALLAGIGTYWLQTLLKNRCHIPDIAAAILLILLCINPLVKRVQLLTAEDQDIYRNQLTLINLQNDLRNLDVLNHKLLTNNYARVVPNLTGDILPSLILSQKMAVALDQYDFLLLDWDERGIYVRGKDFATSLAEARQHPSFTIEWDSFAEYYNTYTSLEGPESAFSCIREYVLTHNGTRKVIKLFSRKSKA